MSMDPESAEAKLEEKLKPFKNIIPESIQKELKTAAKSGDVAQLSALIIGKVDQILEDYIARIMNGNLYPDQQILWLHQIKKGLLHREVVEEWIITNFRALKRFPVTKENPTPRFAAVGLAISDSVVMNQQRRSKGNRVGTFTGAGGGTFAGTAVGLSSSTSTAYGDLVFVFDGKEVLRFQGISDPQGVRRLIQTLVKQGRT